jgi:hypothetical protein
MAGFWPTADADPASTPFVKEFARIWRDMPKVVYSRTLTSAGWNTTIAREAVREEVDRIYVHPIQIGEGKRLFPPSQEKVLLRLAETRTFGNGVVLLRYERLRPGTS